MMYVFIFLFLLFLQMEMDLTTPPPYSGETSPIVQESCNVTSTIHHLQDDLAEKIKCLTKKIQELIHIGKQLVNDCERLKEHLEHYEIILDTNDGNFSETMVTLNKIIKDLQTIIGMNIHKYESPTSQQSM